MEKSEIKGFIAKRCAKELKDGDVVNLGIGLPTLIPHYLPEGVELIIHAELGIVSAGKAPKEGDENYDPYHVVDAGGSPASVAYGGGFIDSASNFGLIRGGHVDACFLGALEVDAEGNLANWIIPGKKMPGMGGAMDLCVGAKHCIVCMEHTATGNPKIFEKCRLPLTASHCVNKIITEMCVFEVTDNEQLDPEYLMLWFSRPEFDRYARYMSHGSVREIFDWDELCKVELPVPSIEKQHSIVKAYNTITDRIELKRKINDNLAA